MNLIDHTKTFIVAPCRYVPIPHGLRFGRHSDSIYTIRRAEGSRSNSSPRLGGSMEDKSWIQQRPTLSAPTFPTWQAVALASIG